MLRESSKLENHNVALKAIISELVESGIPNGQAIIEFVDAAILRDQYELPDARQQLIDQLGVEATQRVAEVAANFQMMNRILDAVGVPVNQRLSAVVDELGLTIPDHLIA
jgi:hypothetical protein